MHCGHCGARMPAPALDKRTRFGFASSVPGLDDIAKQASVPEQAPVPEQASVPEQAPVPSVPEQEDLLSTCVDSPPDLPEVTRHDQPAVDDQTTNNSAGRSKDVHQLALHTPVTVHTHVQTGGTEPVVYTTETPSSIPPTVEAKRQQPPKTQPRSKGTALRIGMLLGGLVLIALFSVPWGHKDSSLLFSWDLMGSLSGMDFILRIYLAAVGVVMLVAGALPLPTSVRGSIGVLLTGFPLATFMVAYANPSWIALTTCSVILAAALLHKANAPGSILAGIVACICFVGVLVAMVIPMDQGKPMLIQFFSGWSGEPLVVAAHVLDILLILLILSSIPVVFARLATPARIIAVALVLYAPADLFLRAMAQLQSAPFLDQAVPTYTSLSLLVYCPIAALSLAAFYQVFRPQKQTC
jgi:hypothetical protein